jgi:hypothetical protein
MEVCFLSLIIILVEASLNPPNPFLKGRFSLYPFPPVIQGMTDKGISE